MLRSMEGTITPTGLPARSFSPLVMSAAIMLLGLGMIALRGFAQPPSETAKEAETPVQYEFIELPAADPTLGMFRRTPLDPSTVAVNNRGMVALRVAELAERPEVKPFIPAVNGFLSTRIFSTLQSDAVPINIGAIEWAAAHANLRVDSVAGDDEKKDHRVMVGAGGFVVKLREAVDLTRWFQRYAPTVKRYVVEGRDVFQIPSIPALGPMPIWVSLRDERTIQANAVQLEVTPDTKLDEIFGDSMWGGGTNQSRWASAWNRIDGGLASLVVTDAEIYDLGAVNEGADEFEQAMEELAQTLFLRCNTFAYAFDLVPGRSNLGIRLRLTHSSRGPANKSLQEIRQFIAVAESEAAMKLDEQDDEGSENNREALLLLAHAIGHLVVSVEEIDDGSADVVISAAVPFDRLVRLFAETAAQEL